MDGRTHYAVARHEHSHDIWKVMHKRPSTLCGLGWNCEVEVVADCGSAKRWRAEKVMRWPWHVPWPCAAQAHLVPSCRRKSRLPSQRAQWHAFQHYGVVMA